MTPPNRPASVARAIAACLAPPRAADPPPPWLRAAQEESFRRTLAAVRHYGGALLADPVGTGKSWVALAVAHALAVPTTCLVPAALAPQWQRVAREAGVGVVVQSHESWSRATRPLTQGLVIVDESHRFRHPAIHRYSRLARALHGQRVLLLSATPVVNRLDDLLHQLLLCCRDDALATSGVPSLTQVLREQCAPSALAEVVVRAQQQGAGPTTLSRQIPATPAERHRAQRAWEALSRLQLSPDPAVRRLMRTCIAYSLASSTDAALETLHRYRQLLLQAQDGARVGVALSRRIIQRALLGDATQTVLWSLLGDSGEATDLCTDDLARLDATCAQLADVVHQGDPKVARLQDLLSDGRPSLVFCAFRATVHALRRQLTPRSRVAWCTGDAAGIGTARLAREMVLGWFRPGMRDPTGLGPRVLVTTDVAAEGLDLQLAARVVHYDLPWTAVRLEQRAGRVARLGSPHAAVEDIQLQPVPLLERELGIRTALTRKGRLGCWGDHDPPRMAWEAREALARRAAGMDEWRGLALGTSTRVRGLAAFEVLRGGAVVGRIVKVLASGAWQDDPELLAHALEDASQDTVASAGAMRRARATLQRAERQVALLHRHGVAERCHPPEQVRARRIIRRWARQAEVSRNHEALSAAARAHAVLARGLTAAERTWAEAICAADHEELAHLVAPATRKEAEGPCRLRLVGCIHFEPPSR